MTPGNHPAEARRRRPTLRAAVRWLFLVAVVAGLATALAGQWDEVVDSLTRLHPGVAAGAVLLVVLGLQFSVLAWRAILTDLGSPLPLLTGARILYIGQLGKYVPGSVWPIVAQMELSKDVGVPRARAATASLISTAIAVVTGAGLGALCVPALLGGDGRQYLLALLLVPAGLAALHPRVVNAVIDRALRVVRRPPLERRLSGAGIARSCLWYLVAYTCFGAQAWVLAADLGSAPWTALPLAIGGYALATAAGIAFLIAPAGAGVRELVIVATLATVIATPAAVAVAIVSRLANTGADALVAGAAGLSFWSDTRHRRSSARRPAAEP